MNFNMFLPGLEDVQVTKMEKIEDGEKDFCLNHESFNTIKSAPNGQSSYNE